MRTVALCGIHVQNLCLQLSLGGVPEAVSEFNMFQLALMHGLMQPILFEVDLVKVWKPGTLPV